jgi:hypothetical protein
MKISVNTKKIMGLTAKVRIKKIISQNINQNFTNNEKKLTLGQKKGQL